MGGTIIQSVTIPKCAEGEVPSAYRTAMRTVNAHAFVNSCFRATVKDGVMSNVKLAFGVVQHKAVFAEEAQQAMEGGKLDGESLAAALEETQYFCTKQPEGKEAYRRNLTRTFVYKFFLTLLEKSGIAVPESLKSAPAVLIDTKATSSGKQVFEQSSPTQSRQESEGEV